MNFEKNHRIAEKFLESNKILAEEPFMEHTNVNVQKSPASGETEQRLLNC
ncbi:hypothetical protein SAMN04489723_103253 [Algoriphagus aquimarinus]|uniref:Uncharacterized protein n=1 Tax=Algoriphagus aquimarinus TaxID=237018 RepID=A0A1I0XL21_9BACT|nr:hypothetical protein SAMN04489723_103253 [Algoriphagus aquimarinus]